MKSILVTGSEGQLGQEINQIKNQYPDFQFFMHDRDLDITDLNALNNFFKSNKIDYIINCAAYTAVDKAESEIDKANLLNGTAIENLLKASSEQASKLIQISTDYVFGGFQNKPIEENEPTAPESAYGSSKLAGEMHAQKSQRAIIIRTSWLYSSFGHNFVKTIRKYGQERGDLKVVFDQVGTPTYAGDLAKAILDIIVFSENNGFKSDVFHYANEGVVSWFDFAWEICRISGIEAQIHPVLSEAFPTPAKRPVYSVLNKSKIRNTFGIDIPYWKDSLKVCIDKL